MRARKARRPRSGGCGQTWNPAGQTTHHTPGSIEIVVDEDGFTVSDSVATSRQYGTVTLSRSL